MTHLLALLLGVASAQDCDATQLKAQFTEATPVSTARAWTQWASCDPEGSRRQTAAALGKMLAGDEANGALSVAIEFGETAAVFDWVGEQEAGHRSKAIAALGGACSTTPAVEAFLLSAPAKLGDDFWKQRWYRAFSTCRTDGVRAWLGQSLDSKAAESAVDDNDFTGILEVYSRNLGADAIPKLRKLAAATDSDDRMVYIIGSFADAANVGSADGLDADAALKGTQAIIELAPEMDYRSVENARATLEALGAQANADAMAAHRWRDRYVEGKYSYVAIARELTTCKNTKRMGVFHHAHIAEAGARWPEQLEAILAPKLEREWELGAFAERCKGEVTIEFAFPGEPFADDQSRDDWIESQREAFQTATEGFDKREPAEHDVILLF